MTRRLSFTILLVIILAPLNSRPASAEELVWATGKVLSDDGKAPLADAIVAVYDDKNRVIDYARTGPDGEYTLAVPRNALHLGGHGGGGFLHQVFDGIGSAVGGAGRVVALPLKMGIRAAASASTVADPVTRIGIGTASGVAQTLADGLSPRGGKHAIAERNLPGVLVMKVTRPGRNDAVALARAYWMQEQIFHENGRDQKVLAVWVDPANLTSAGNEKPSTIKSDYLTFTEARLEPSIAEPGQTVDIIARLPSPPDPQTPVIVVARNAKTGKLYGLEAQGDGFYRGRFVVDKHFPKNDQAFTILAYAAQDENSGRIKKTEDAIIGAGLMNPDKPYLYDPLVVVSRNRAAATLTVVEPRKRRR